jgi:hypothetical protein
MHARFATRDKTRVGQVNELTDTIPGAFLVSIPPDALIKDQTVFPYTLETRLIQTVPIQYIHAISLFLAFRLLFLKLFAILADAGRRMRYSLCGNLVDENKKILECDPPDVKNSTEQILLQPPDRHELLAG